MEDSNGRKMIHLVIDRSWYPDLMVTEAYYQDSGEPVPVDELEMLDNDEIAWYMVNNI